MRGGNILKISEFAKKAGVTVKTLLHYDKIELLKPSKKTDSGYRVYCEEDFLKLQQITTLKFIGLSLNEINQFLHQDGQNLENIISLQKKALEEKKKHIESVITVFNKAENQIIKDGFLEVANLIDIIKITNMESRVKEQYKTSENFKMRGKLHSYNTNDINWNDWCFNKIEFPSNAKILELGCGSGDLWYKNKHNIREDLNITLSDFSTAMLEGTKERLSSINHKFIYKEIDAQNIPYEDESFDIVIARHMLYLVPDIEKALLEIKRVLVKGGTFYVTTNSCDSMTELNKLVEMFDSSMGLNNNGLCERFDAANGQPLLETYFNEVNMDILRGNIVVNDAEAIVAYKASTIKGSSILVGEKRMQFKKFIEKYIEKNGDISITTKSCLFRAKK